MSSESQPSRDRAASLALLVADLDAGERGFVLGRLSTMRGEGVVAESPLAGEAGRRCAEAMERIEALPRTERLRLMNALAGEALAPFPAGLEHVHPDTLRALLAEESAATIRLLAAGADAPAVLRETAEQVLAERAVGPGEADPTCVDEPPVAQNGDGDGERPALEEIRRAVLAPVIPVPVRPSAAVAPERLGLALAALDGPQLLDQLTRAGLKISGAPPAEGTGGDPSVESLRRRGASALGSLLRTDDPAQVEVMAQRLPADLAQRLRAGASGAADARSSQHSGLVDDR